LKQKKWISVSSLGLGTIGYILVYGTVPLVIILIKVW